MFDNLYYKFIFNILILMMRDEYIDEKNDMQSS